MPDTSINLYMGQGIAGDLRELTLVSKQFSNCAPVVMFNSETKQGGLFHVPGFQGNMPSSTRGALAEMLQKVKPTEVFVLCGNDFSAGQGVAGGHLQAVQDLIKEKARGATVHFQVPGGLFGPDVSDRVREPQRATLKAGTEVDVTAVSAISVTAKDGNLTFGEGGEQSVDISLDNAALAAYCVKEGLSFVGNPDEGENLSWDRTKMKNEIDLGDLDDQLDQMEQCRLQGAAADLYDAGQNSSLEITDEVELYAKAKRQCADAANKLKKINAELKDLKEIPEAGELAENQDVDAVRQTLSPVNNSASKSEIVDKFLKHPQSEMCQQDLDRVVKSAVEKKSQSRDKYRAASENGLDVINQLKGGAAASTLQLSPPQKSVGEGQKFGSGMKKSGYGIPRS